ITARYYPLRIYNP
ncbi:putative transport protein, partial [Chlamydia psittaci 08-2626_L3]